MILPILYVAVIVAILVGLALVGRDRRWTDEEYERLKEKGPGIGNALLEVQSLIEPAKNDLLDARLESHAEEDDSGDPPDPGR